MMMISMTKQQHRPCHALRLLHTALLFFTLQSTTSAYNNSPHNEPKPLMRAWMCSGKTQSDMIGKLAQAGIVKTSIIKEALLRVDRKNYAPRPDSAYEDSPQQIGYGATISAPHMHAHVLEELLPPLLTASETSPDNNKLLKILDVGCGSGYLTSVFGRLVESKENRRKSTVLNEGKVYGIDVVPELVDMSKTNTMKEDGDLLDSHTVEFLCRDGWKG
jgi:protein-L-isoaspartate(D-aspartate) O-methyltransferase